MSILDRIRGKGRSIPPSATFRITEQGREKMQEFSGDARSRILVALETRGTSDMEEIASTSRLSRGQVENLVPKLVRNGYIQYVSSAMGSDLE